MAMIKNTSRGFGSKCNYFYCSYVRVCWAVHNGESNKFMFWIGDLKHVCFMWFKIAQIFRVKLIFMPRMLQINYSIISPFFRRNKFKCLSSLNSSIRYAPDFKLFVQAIFRARHCMFIVKSVNFTRNVIAI